MIYDLSSEFELEKAIKYFSGLCDRKPVIELKKYQPKRTDKQNRYLHAILGVYGLDLGLTVEESKTVVKRELGFYYEKNGNKFLKSTANLPVDEMSDFIEKFRNHASQLGIYLPSSEEYYADTDKVDAYIERNEPWL